MKKENRRKENHNEKTNHNGRTNPNDKDTRAMRSSGNTMTPHKTLWHPISTPIFFFYTIMSAINGSASLMLLGTAAAFGAWILEEIFMATSGPAQSGKCFRHRRDRKDSDVPGQGWHSPESISVTESVTETVCRRQEYPGQKSTKYRVRSILFRARIIHGFKIRNVFSPR